MAYTAALLEGEITLNDYPPVWQEIYGEKRQKLQTYLMSFGWRAFDESELVLGRSVVISISILFTKVWLTASMWVPFVKPI
jgi:hypothetical protein